MKPPVTPRAVDETPPTKVPTATPLSPPHGRYGGTPHQRGVFGSPPPRLRVVIPRAKAHEPRVAIVEPTGEAERLEARIRVGEHAPEFVVIHPLLDDPCSGVDDEPRAPEVIGEEPVRHEPLFRANTDSLSD